MPQQYPHRESFLRASDADREFVAGVLREHTGDGRLTLPEFEDRVAKAYAATTLDDLYRLVDDLPVSIQGKLPVPTGAIAHRRPGYAPAAQTQAGRPPAPIALMWAPWVAVTAICLGIWLVVSVASAGAVYFWPFWVFGPWGFILLRRTVGGGGHGRYRAHHGWH